MLFAPLLSTACFVPRPSSAKDAKEEVWQRYANRDESAFEGDHGYVKVNSELL